MHQNRLAAGLCPDPLRELTALPRPRNEALEMEKGRKKNGGRDGGKEGLREEERNGGKERKWGRRERRKNGWREGRRAGRREESAREEGGREGARMDTPIFETWLRPSYYDRWIDRLRLTHVKLRLDVICSYLTCVQKPACSLANDIEINKLK